MIQGRNVHARKLEFYIEGEEKPLSNFKEGNNRIKFVSFYGDWTGERPWQLAMAMAGMHTM